MEAHANLPAGRDAEIAKKRISNRSPVGILQVLEKFLQLRIASPAHLKSRTIP